jgi:hypothetical protein
MDAIQKMHTPPTLANAPAAIAELERQRPEGETVYVFAKANVECAFYTGDLQTRSPKCALSNAHVLTGRWPPEPSAVGPSVRLVDARGEWAEQEAQRILAGAEGRFWLLSTGDSWRTEFVGSALARNGAVLEERNEWEGAELIRYRVRS